MATLLRWSLLVVLVGSLGVALFRPPVAHACSCALQEDPAAALQRSVAVFTGRVVAINSASRVMPNVQRTEGFPFIQFGSDFTPVRVVFDVTQVWKGGIGSRTTVQTGTGGGDCGFEFTPGQAYVVYAYAADNALTTSICDRTNTLAGAQAELAAFGPGTAPQAVAQPPSSTTSLPLIMTAVVVVLVVLSILVIARRRRARAV